MGHPCWMTPGGLSVRGPGTPTGNPCRLWNPCSCFSLVPRTHCGGRNGSTFRVILQHNYKMRNLLSRMKEIKVIKFYSFSVGPRPGTTSLTQRPLPSFPPHQAPRLPVLGYPRLNGVVKCRLKSPYLKQRFWSWTIIFSYIRLTWI